MAEEPVPAAPPPPTRNPLKRLYRWVLSWAHHPAGTWALAAFSFLDSAVFPVPPLFLQVALSIERPRRSWWYASVNTVASVLGACLGYYIGYALYRQIGVRIVGEITPDIRARLENDAFAVTLVYSFIPLPYKLITIGSGYLHLSLTTLLVASTIGRSARFFALAAVCFFLRERSKGFIERYFNWVMLAIALLVAAGIVVMKTWFGATAP